MAEASLVTQMRTERFAGPWELERALPGTQTLSPKLLRFTGPFARPEGKPCGCFAPSLPSASSQALGVSSALTQHLTWRKEAENVSALGTQIAASFDLLLSL